MIAQFAAYADRTVIIGGGAAGLATALALAPMPVLLISKAPLGTAASSALAQGGIAASLAVDDDPVLHFQDTIAAGDGLVDPDVARLVTEAGPGAIRALVDLGAEFDRDGDGHFRLGLEAAHQRQRIVHADGDRTGRELMRTLVKAVQSTPSITTLVPYEARRLIVEENVVQGVVIAGPNGAATVRSSRVILATGGVGGLFEATTNPLECFGQGLALAAHAGAVLADLEFIQYHPTALATSTRPLPLISEAVRGEGASLIDDLGVHFMASIPGGELAPRDVVARAVWQRASRGRRTFLDGRRRPGSSFSRKFPEIFAACQAAGIDPENEPIPVRPAVHYHMGGVAVDIEGRSSVRGLWACGEVACTGLHGANRLASNSLLELIVFAQIVARGVAGEDLPAARPSTQRFYSPFPSDPALARPILSQALGLERDRSGLVEAVSDLLPLALAGGPAADPAMVGLMIAVSALNRMESRGAHFRSDFPLRGEPSLRSSLDWAATLAMAHEVAAAQPIARRV
ncbi:L-aspartate oxidase [Mesorhizobium sp. B2-3-5]|uniref:L-aspartate oxidase n=1 Tax=Mesorhizobium sp. B2-3-5 TaxID=2589958 RepID=UPI00112DA75D|nr:L-aspartate oxidase [Mesorhizobium sp. B2-3-5]TPM24596.1 L-aspartate oxidase [Mesorhizobium sp. B2-3-5]